MEKYRVLLKRSTLFRDIKENEMAALLSELEAKVKDYSADEYVISLGEVVDYIYIVLEGSVKIMKENAAGVSNIVTFIGPSQIFAEGIVCTATRVAPVAALVAEKTKVMRIPYGNIINGSGSGNHYHSKMVRNMMLVLGEKNYALNKKIDILMLKGMRNKLATYLLNEAKRNNSLYFTVTANRSEMADYLNVARTSMSRELSAMREEGIIDFHKNSFKILSHDRLQQAIQA